MSEKRADSIYDMNIITFIFILHSIKVLNLIYHPGNNSDAFCTCSGLNTKKMEIRAIWIFYS